MGIRRALFTWLFAAGCGAASLAVCAVCALKGYFTWVPVCAFAGCLLLLQAGKRILFLTACDKKLRSTDESALLVTLFYRDKNEKEMELSVIPAGVDAYNLYGFAPQQKTLKAFRRERILRAARNGKDIPPAELFSL